MIYSKTFQELAKADVDIAGGKGASLGEMTQAGLPVPPGFVVLAESFDYFIKGAGLYDKIEAELLKVDINNHLTIDQASEHIRNLILTAEMPSDIKSDAESQFASLNAELVAVRSSATAEDSSAASWAGELESYLNVTSENLLESIKKCWSSLFTPRAIFYRFEKELDKHRVSVAVVVQKMVQSEVSGVAFTVHPVTEDYNQMVIEAGYGLGEAIVGGLITPDTYVIDKAKIEIADKYISEQAMMIVRGPQGTEEIDIPVERRELQKLVDEKIIELAKICLSIERHYGFPCDIEWALEHGVLYVTQSRPITTLAAISIVKDQVDLSWLQNLSPWEKIGTRKATLHRYFDFVECSRVISKELFGTNLETSVCIIDKGEIKQYQGEKDYESYISGFDKFFEDNQKVKHAREHMVSDSENFMVWLEANCKKSTLTKLSNEELIGLVIKRHDMHQLLAAWQWFGFTGKYAIEKSITKRLDKYSLSHDLAKAILSLARPVFVLKEDLELKKIALAVQAGGLSTLDLQKKIKSHVRKYGHYVMYDETYAAMTIESAKNRVADLVKTTVLATSIDEASAQHKTNKNQFSKIVKNKKLSSDDKLFFEFAHDYAEFMELRNQYRGLSAKLSQPLFGVIAKRFKTTLKDLLCYSDSEIVKFLNKEIAFDDSEAKKRFERSAMLYNSGVVKVETGVDEVGKIEDIVNIQQHHEVIRGNVAFPGVARGVVKIINSVDGIANLNEGDILVSSMTRPDFLSAIKKAAAIVTDEGGITCHAAIVSRELKKPCVIGTKVATHVLKDGDLVEVDANQGLIKILS